ncbi:MAG: DNA-directed RNA polymerase subunit alpha [Phycisphaerales bacterium]|nr:DNA-directed RNA polymerase subunit alpha [Phycisphaerales bacterium]
MRIRWRGLELPTRVMRDDAASTQTYGRFIVEPFERGFGTTVGNSLRRILLSSLQGAAVTHVKIKGADHEFMTLAGVNEDISEVILNVKSLIVKSTSDTSKTMRLAVKGKSGQMTEIRASEIEADAALEVVNKDQLLVTLTDDVEFEMEMTVACGRSYVTADENKPENEDQVIGVIPVDSVFSPITRVRYHVEDTRVGQSVNYDRLVMEIWTNGTVKPEMALVEAAKILRKHLNPFVQYFELGQGLGLEGSIQEADSADASAPAGADESKSAMPISVLDLSVRSSNCLASANITTLGELLQYDEGSLLKLRSFGKTSLREVKRKLADHGLALQPSEDGENLEDGDSGEASDVSGFQGAPSSTSVGIAPLDSGTMNDSAQSFSSPAPPSSESDKEVGIAREDIN